MTVTIPSQDPIAIPPLRQWHRANWHDDTTLRDATITEPIRKLIISKFRKINSLKLVWR